MAHHALTGRNCSGKNVLEGMPPLILRNSRIGGDRSAIVSILSIGP